MRIQSVISFFISLLAFIFSDAPLMAQDKKDTTNILNGMSWHNISAPIAEDVPSVLVAVQKENSNTILEQWEAVSGKRLMAD